MPTGLSASRFVSLDFETTGLYAQSDRIVEIGAVAFELDGNELGVFSRLINPGRPIPADARAIHGIGDHAVRDAPTAAEVLPGFLRWIASWGEVELLAHNASFDTGFLGRELGRAGLPLPGYSVIDTVPIAQRLWPFLPNHRLDTVAAFLGLGLDDAHRAVGDCRRVMGIWLAATRLAAPEDGVWKSARLVLPLVRYPVYDPGPPPAPALPAGFEWLSAAIASESAVQIEYLGGTRGPEPRTITPRGVVSLGQTRCLLALCHIDRIEKHFRFDLIRWAKPVDRNA